MISHLDVFKYMHKLVPIEHLVGTNQSYFCLSFKYRKGRREPSIEYDEGEQENCSIGGEDREDEFHLEAVSRQT